MATDNQAGHDACLQGTGTGAPIMLGGQTLSCVQLAASQSLFFPGNKTRPAVVPGSQIPECFPMDYRITCRLALCTRTALPTTTRSSSLAKAPTHGLYFSLAYTYSHALDNSSSLEDSVANGYNVNSFPGFAYLSYGIQLTMRVSGSSACTTMEFRCRMALEEIQSRAPRWAVGTFPGLPRFRPASRLRL